MRSERATYMYIQSIWYTHEGITESWMCGLCMLHHYIIEYYIGWLLYRCIMPNYIWNSVIRWCSMCVWKVLKGIGFQRCLVNERSFWYIFIGGVILLERLHHYLRVVMKRLYYIFINLTYFFRIRHRSSTLYISSYDKWELDPLNTCTTSARSSIRIAHAMGKK